jgi:PAS domain S-box-containing protein
MQTMLLVSLGLSVYAALFHLGMRRQSAAHGWLALWAVGAAVFIGARLLSLAADTPETAVLSSRIAASTGTLLVLALARFVESLTGSTWSRVTRVAVGCSSLVLGALSLFSPLVICDATTPREGYFGEQYLGSIAGPLMPAYMLHVVIAIAWATCRLHRSSDLAVGERRALSGALLLYSAMGLTNAFATLNWISVPPVGEFGPLVVVLGISQLAARRQRRLEVDLAWLAEEKLARLDDSEARYRGLVEASKIGVASVDCSGVILAVTPRMYEMFEMPVGDAGRGVNLLELPITRSNGMADLVRRVIERGKAVSVESRQPTARGRGIDVRAIVAPHRDAAGRVAGALVLLEDVTERRAIESRLRQSQKMESVGELAGGIARGITAPMESVRDNLARVREACDALSKQLARRASEEQREHFGEIEQLVDEAVEGVQRALGIVSDMREISNGGSLESGPVDLNQLLAGVVRMASTQRQRAELVERYGPVPRVTGNAGQLRQVFLNLVVNAMQATRSRVWVETLHQGERVLARVSDDGPGIAPEHRERLFEPFFTTKPAGQGTGLGLFLSYQIVQSHGGEIRFRPDLSAGASFEVSLPIAPPSAHQAAA